MSEEFTTSEEEQFLERIVRNQLLIKELEEENATLKGFYKQNNNVVPVGTKREVGKFYVKSTSNTRIDDALAKQHLSAEWYKRVSKQVVDTTKVRKVGLATSVVEKITKTYDPKIEVGLR